MYSLTFNNELIYDPRASEDMLVIYESDVQLAVGAAGSMTFTVPPTHPLLDKLTVLKGTLDLKQDGKSIFRGRILHKKPVMGGEVEIISEGVLAYLNDSIVEPFVFPDDFLEDPGYNAAASGGNVVEWWLGWLLNNHNAQVGDEKQIHLGKVTVRDPNNYVKRSCEDFTHTLKVINEKLPGSSLGGYLMIRYGDDGNNYLDYIAEFTETNDQLVAYGENLLDINRDISGESVITAILPIGVDGLTISDLPDGDLPNGLKKEGKVIYDPSAEERYGGRIVEPFTWDDVTIDTNLQTKAAAYLLKAVALPENITVKACDLHGVDEDIPSFTLGQYAIVHNPRDVKDKAMYPVMEIQPDIHDPGNTVLTLGRTTTTLSKSTYTDNRSMVDAIETYTSEAVKQASEEMNALLARASGLYCTAEVQPDGSTIYYLHDKKTLAGSRNVIKLTAEAIGFSTDGGSTYPYGFTITGEMVARLLSAHGVNADWITTGILQSHQDKNGSRAFYLDLVNGILKGHFSELTIDGNTVYNIANSSASSAASGALSSAKEYADNATSDALSDAKGYADDAAKAAVNAQTQRDIFNRLTNNGEDQGIYLRDGKIYINLEYLKTNILDLNLLTLAGTNCGLKQGYGSTRTGRTTQGIVMYGKGLNGSGDANPPYLIVTDGGIRGQTSDTYNFNMAGSAFQVAGNISTIATDNAAGNITAAGEINATGDIGTQGKIYAAQRLVAQYFPSNNLMQFGGSCDTYIGGTTVYISNTGQNTKIRGNIDFTNSPVTNFPLKRKTVTGTPNASYGAVSLGLNSDQHAVFGVSVRLAGGSINEGFVLRPNLIINKNNNYFAQILYMSANGDPGGTIFSTGSVTVDVLYMDLSSTLS